MTSTKADSPAPESFTQAAIRAHAGDLSRLPGEVLAHSRRVYRDFPRAEGFSEKIITRGNK